MCGNGAGAVRRTARRFGTFFARVTPSRWRCSAGSAAPSHQPDLIRTQLFSRSIIPLSATRARPRYSWRSEKTTVPSFSPPSRTGTMAAARYGRIRHMVSADQRRLSDQLLQTCSVIQVARQPGDPSRRLTPVVSAHWHRPASCASACRLRQRSRCRWSARRVSICRERKVTRTAFSLSSSRRANGSIRLRATGRHTAWEKE